MRAVASAIAIALVAVSGVASQERSARGTDRGPGARARASILAFDACVQERFKDVDERFGLRRIITVGETPHRFRPENLREDAAVGDLERERLRVVLYLIGRKVLRPDLPTPQRVGLVKGPVVVTRSTAESGAIPAPAPVDLLAYSRQAMTAFATEPRYEFSVAGWTFVASPVRASAASCLHCHEADGTTSTTPRRDREPTLRLGDPLGAVLYAYRAAR